MTRKKLPTKQQNGWRMRLHRVYNNSFEQFVYYSDMYGISKRLGFRSNKQAWEANPIIAGSIYPKDLRIAS